MGQRLNCASRDWNTVRGSYGGGLDKLKETEQKENQHTNLML